MTFITKSIVFAYAAALILALSAPTPAIGDEWDWTTHISPNQPLEVPGLILEPNRTYLIRTLPGSPDRNVVQVFTENRMELLTQFLTIDETRDRPEEDTIFEFMEVPAGNPLPIRAWFYPGTLTGLEFVYPKEQQERIAAYTDRTMPTAQTTSVVSTGSEDADLNADFSSEPIAESAAVIQEPDTQSESQSEDALGEEPVADDSVERTDIDTENPSVAQLPATSGALTLVGLLGGLCAALGLTLRFGRS